MKIENIEDCRIKRQGEMMSSGDIVLINDKFMSLGFNTGNECYFAGNIIEENMQGKIITESVQRGTHRR